MGFLACINSQGKSGNVTFCVDVKTIAVFIGKTSVGHIFCRELGILSKLVSILIAHGGGRDKAAVWHFRISASEILFKCVVIQCK